MKLYYFNSGNYGSIVVIANSKEEAVDIMKKEDNYDEFGILTEYNIVSGLKLVNKGELE